MQASRERAVRTALEPVKRAIRAQAGPLCPSTMLSDEIRAVDSPGTVVTWLDLQAAAIEGADIGAAKAVASLRPTIEGLQNQVADLTRALADAGRAHEDIERRLNESTKDAERREASIVREAKMAALEVAASARGMDGAPGAAGRDGKDGSIGVPDKWLPGTEHLRGSMVTHKGGLFVSLSDTTSEPGEAGAWRCIVAGLASVDVGSDGDQFHVEVRQSDGTVRRAQAKLPGVRYRGVWAEQNEYGAGDSVTQGGSLWVAERGKSLGQPGVGASGWRLAVKRGSDGKSAAEPAPVRPHFYSEFVGRSKAGDLVRHGAWVWLCVRETHEAPRNDHASWVKLGA